MNVWVAMTGVTRHLNDAKGEGYNLPMKPGQYLLISRNCS